MIAFFTALRTIRAVYKGLRALVGILIVSHGTYKWVQAKRT